MTRILGIETSCDETAAAVVEDRTRVRSNVVASSAEVHRRYGGVVPELASRHQVEAIGPVVQLALEQARTGLEDVDAVAVTYGPGLVGSLLVGVSAAKAIAWQRRIPLLAVNHLEGHIRSCFLEHAVAFPVLALVVSGGHTHLYLCPEEGVYRTLARTRDDAAGEAFDKVAKLLGRHCWGARTPEPPRSSSTRTSPPARPGPRTTPTSSTFRSTSRTARR